ncbi:ATP-dependent nuclease [Bacillus suaedaesalsae]|uniref:AAA family ATPase n=1 Tax=Bacillus suaedaesalsae TaxID=2810349 RepID=A0ABS2DGY6_9BACI|nr:AAA family ATPase [Bacillus suaedaesalsae]MBM6617295.1 AAA family ATPase [Bacillus suaedaesalsae]
MKNLMGPHISNIVIKNFRNFKEVDVSFSHKQMIIGENNVGKTNLIKAIQLILDPKLSDEDRFLSESDFHDSLDRPMETGEEIEIIIEIKGFEHNQNILSILSDATVSDEPPTLRLTYRFYPITRADGTYDYQYTIYQGENQEVEFTHLHRKYLQLKVINAIRDVESEIKNTRRSPVNQLLKQYQIDKEELREIAEKLKEKSNEVLTIGEIEDLERNINMRFSKVLGVQPDTTVSLETVDIDPNRILNTLKLMIGDTKQRPTSETSLGLNNILYISLILLSLEDKTIPTFIRKEKYDELREHDAEQIILKAYDKYENGNYYLKYGLTDEILTKLYTFMDEYNPVSEGFTILAIEEPEAHLHPTLQRIIYKDVMNSNTSVLMTTHSPYITSVAPLESIVHLGASKNGTNVNTTASLELTNGEKRDLERFIDVKRGEIYFGKGILLVEGIAEEYMIPSFADLLQKPLDLKGIVTCNVNSTNFKPFVKFLDLLGIPYVVITDGDYYTIIDKKSGERKYHTMIDELDDDYGYLGLELIGKLLIELGKIESNDIPEDLTDQDSLFNHHGFYIGDYTMEVDIFETCKKKKVAQEIICSVFEELTSGGTQQKKNFKIELGNGDYFSCLRKIESSGNGIGKGRFAQRLSSLCTIDHIPDYIKNAIVDIYNKVDEV